MANPLVELISISQQTERLLEERFNARGRGLREKLDSVSAQIPENIRKQIRFIATTRNLATHGELENAPLKLRNARRAFKIVSAALAPSGSSASSASSRKTRVVDDYYPSFFFKLKSIFARVFGSGVGAGASFARLNAVARETERLLTRYYKAQGRGLHDKLTSVASQLPEKTQRKIRFIATIRNKAAHEDLRVADENIEKIEEAFAEIRPTLDRGAPLRKVAFWLATAGVLLAAFFVFCALR